MEYIATVVKYNKNGVCGIATGTFEEICKVFDVENMTNDIYFKLARFNDTTYDYIEEKHFGCLCKKRGGLKITEGIYCNAYFNNQIKRYLKDKEWRKYEDFLLLVRFCTYFKHATQLPSLETKQEFDNWISKSFTEWEKVYDLQKYHNTQGLYALILDDYAKCYIGQAENIKKRVQQHWSKESFVTKGIDLFRAKDTTRIYALPIDKKAFDVNEYMWVQKIPVEFRLNFLQGGCVDFHANTNTPLFFDTEQETQEIWWEQQEKEEREMYDYFKFTENDISES